MSEPKPIGFTITDEEGAAISEPQGGGGQRSFHRRLIDALANGNRTLSFNDAETGYLFRNMTYGWDDKGGGFQSRLKKAFLRSFREMPMVWGYSNSQHYSTFYS